MRRAAVSLVALLGLLGPGLGSHLARAGEASPRLFRATSERVFDDVEHWIRVFDDPARDAWQKPAEVVEALGLAPGARVADLGAGTGYFVPYLVAAVGAEGVVYAVEVEPKLVVHLRERAEREEASNVIPVLASPDHPRLPRAGVDLVLIVDTFHHIDGRLEYFRRLRRALADGGRVAIIDWYERELPKGPPPAHKLSEQQVIEEMTRAGYRLLRRHELLPYQYFLILAPDAGAS